MWIGNNLVYDKYRDTKRDDIMYCDIYYFQFIDIFLSLYILTILYDLMTFNRKAHIVDK